MIDVKQAVKAAVNSAQELLGTERTQDLRLEEVELSEPSGGGPEWLITLSMVRPPSPAEKLTQISILSSLAAAKTANTRRFRLIRRPGPSSR